MGATGLNRKKLHAAIAACASLLLSACGGNSVPDLVKPTNGGTPDEFGILTTKPLEEPDTYAFLPQPRPGGRNRVDFQPEEDAIAALGGNANVAASRSGDGALLAATGRFGITPGIRRQLAVEDLEYRQANRGRPLERWFNNTLYYSAYEPQSLDQHRELARFRAAGIPTSAPPPDPTP